MLEPQTLLCELLQTRYANCTDVEDLCAPWPLKPCTWGRDGKDAQLTTHMHRVKVIKGYGVPFFPDVNMLDKLRKDLDGSVLGL